MNAAFGGGFNSPRLHRYENRSTLMTSNRPIEEWGKLLNDVPAASAILDRLLHHAEVISITGRSHQLADSTAGKQVRGERSWGTTVPQTPPPGGTSAIGH